MWRRRTTFLRQVLVVVDSAASVGAFLAALFLRDKLAGIEAGDGFFAEQLLALFSVLGGVPRNIRPDDYMWLLLGLVPIWAVSFHFAGTGEYRLGYRETARRYVRAVLVGLGLFIFATFLFKLEFVARTLVLLFAVVQFAALIFTRIALVEVAALLGRGRQDGHRIVIVGSGRAAVSVSENLARHSPGLVKVLGFVGVPGEEGEPGARPYLGFVGSLASLLDRIAVDEVIFAVPGKQPDVFADAITACDQRGVDVLLTLPPSVPQQSKLEIANVTGLDMPMLGLRRTPTGEVGLAVKRLMDIFGAMIGLVVASPIMVLAAAAIRLESEGPIFFEQVRAGRNGRKFVMFKFRSMVVDAESRQSEISHLNEMDGPVFKMRRDPRITKVGRFLRRTSIDELPQLFNIISGEMSIVGPRPPLPSEVEEYEAWQRRRLSVKPGLTGLWQVSGRDQIDFDEWMELDLAYIDNWSLWLDIKIMFRAIPAVLRGRH